MTRSIRIHKLSALSIFLFTLALCLIQPNCLAQQAPTPLPDVVGEVGGTIGGDFDVSESGAATYKIDLAAPPGTAGMKPNLALAYSSHSKQGVLGMGWSLSGLSVITRCPTDMAQEGFVNVVDYDLYDQYCLDGQRLIAVAGNHGYAGTEYRTVNESFIRIIGNGNLGTYWQNGHRSFTATYKNGLTFEYGTSTDSRLQSEGADGVLSWLLKKVTDRNGNSYEITYARDLQLGEAIPSRIDYTANPTAGLQPYNSIRFTYESEPNPQARYIGGQVYSTTKRISKISMYTDTQLAWEYKLTYINDSLKGLSLLVSIEECAADGVCLPPTTFDWGQEPQNAHEFVLGQSVNVLGVNQGYTSQDRYPLVTGDWNGDGRTDIARANGNVSHFYILTENGSYQHFADVNTPFSGDPNQHFGEAYPIVVGDWNGDGLSDFMRSDLTATGSNNANYFYISNGTSFSSYTVTSAAFSSPSCQTSSQGFGKIYVGDWDGDGRTDLVRVANSSCFNFAVWIQNYSYLNIAGNMLPSISAGTCNLDECPLIVADWNGDGVSDVARVLPDRIVFYVASSWNFQPFYYFLEFATLNRLSPAQGYSDIDTYPILTGDWNADGLMDIGRVGAVNTTLCLSAGQPYIMSGSLFGNCIVSSELSGAQLFSNFERHPLVTGDWNGDGTTDIVRTDDEGIWIYYVKQGALQSAGYRRGLAYSQGFVSQDHNPMFVGDWNGDGFPDLGRVSASGITTLNHIYSETALIQRITNGIGAVTNIEYGRLNESTLYTKGTGAVFPQIDVDGSLKVVKSVSATDGISTNSVITYGYRGLRFNQHSRDSIGFREISATNVSTGVVNTSFFRQNGGAFDGLPTKKETRLSNGTLISKKVDTWASMAVSSYQAYYYISDSVSEEYELDGVLKQRSQTSNTYDGWGNLTQKTLVRRDGSQESLTYTYNNEPNTWVLGQLTSVRTTKTASSLSGSQASTRFVRFTYSPNGLLASETIEPNLSNLMLQKVYRYDAFGNLISTDEGGNGVVSRVTSSVFDPRGQFEISRSNALGHTVNLSYDPRHGKISQTFDPNGINTITTYDGFGRVILEQRPDRTLKRTLYLRDELPVLVNSSYYIREDESGISPIFTYFDAFGREIRRESIGFDGRKVFVDKVYDDAGNLVSETEPYSEGNAALWNLSEFDETGRVQRIIAPGNRQTTFQYDSSLRTTKTNSKQQTSSTRLDEQGQLIESVDADQKVVSYRYDGFGNTIEVIDSLGNTTSMQYDRRGRRTQIDDPDSGVTLFEFNAFGEMTAKTNANGERITFERDALGRVVRRTLPEGQETWVYDTATYGIGQVQRLRGLNGYLEERFYDRYGRVVQTVKTISGKRYKYSQSFDRNGLLAGTIYPSGFGIKNTYNSYGFLSEILRSDNNNLIWKAEGRTSRGQLKEQSFGNGLHSINSYRASDGLLQSISTGSGGAVQELGFQFDSLGNLTERSDLNSGLIESFGYDNLNRLISSEVHGQAPISVSYNEIGNILSRSDVGTYQYGGNGAGPHAVTSIVGVRGNTYHYDQAGNRTSSNTGSVLYGSSGKPVSIVDGVNELQFELSPEEQRTKEITLKAGQVVATKVYVGSLFEEKLAGGVLEQIHYVSVPEGLVAIFTKRAPDKSSSTKSSDSVVEDFFRYVHLDHLGSVQTLTDESGRVVEVLSYNSWGERRDPTTWQNSTGNTSSVERGFTGHEQLDEVSLIHMNGRVYDPVIGRFLSADPFIQTIQNQQSLNRYSYVQNNPLSFTDPSGFFLRGFFKKIGRFLRKAAPIAASIGSLALGQYYLLPALSQTWLGCSVLGNIAAVGITGAVGGLGGSIAGSVLAGAGFSNGLKAGLRFSPMDFLQAAVTYQIGSSFQWDLARRVLAHGAFSAVIGGVRGQKILPAFASGALGAFAGRYGLEYSVLLGGTAAAISGGKFEDGAMNAAFTYLFNDSLHGVKGVVSDIGEGTSILLNDIGNSVSNLEDNHPVGYACMNTLFSSAEITAGAALRTATTGSSLAFDVLSSLEMLFMDPVSGGLELGTSAAIELGSQKVVRPKLRIEPGRVAPLGVAGYRVINGAAGVGEHGFKCLSGLLNVWQDR